MVASVRFLEPGPACLLSAWLRSLSSSREQQRVSSHAFNPSGRAQRRRALAFLSLCRATISIIARLFSPGYFPRFAAGARHSRDDNRHRLPDDSMFRPVAFSFRSIRQRRWRDGLERSRARAWLGAGDLGEIQFYRADSGAVRRVLDEATLAGEPFRWHLRIGPVATLGGDALKLFHER